MKKLTIDGNEAVARGAYLFTELAGIYPITPSSPMAEHIDSWSSRGIKNIFNDEVKVVEMQSEAGASGLLHGSLQAGILTTTFTSSQGLLLMMPNMYKIAGEMLPATFHVAARSLSTHALSIFGDHQDIYAVRPTGFAILASSSVYEANYMAVISHLSSLKSSIPHLHFMDGFRTSHEIDKVNVLEKSDIEDIIPYDSIKEFRNRALNPDKPYTIGVAENDDVYFQGMESRNKFYLNIPDIVNNYMEAINKKTGSDLKPFNYYGSKTAEKIIVAMGSVCETIKLTIDDLNNKGYNVGLVEVHLYRPFSESYFKSVIPETVKSIAVLDRTKEQGSLGEPLYLDVKSIMDCKVVGGRYGLSSKNTNPASIKAVYDMLDNPKHNFTIGIVDDLTNLSLSMDDYKINKFDEIKIYGYGSDGMVGSSKSIMKLIGDNTDKYVQGYFQYDSKKSGGVTISHLRFSDDVIRATYYVDNPKIVVVTKDTYLNSYDVLSDIQDNGIFVINTDKDEAEFNASLNPLVKELIYNKNIKVYIINADKISMEAGIKGKIGSILESAIMSLLDLIDKDKSLELIISSVTRSFISKGEEVVEANIKAVREARNSLKQVIFNDKVTSNHEEKYTNLFDMMTKRLGDKLTTSQVNNNGIYEANTSILEKRMISNIVSTYLKDNCITCGQCSIVCPHGVIRPFLLSKEEYENSPEYVKNNCIVPIEPNLRNDYFYTIGISVKDCTGCGLCVNICPGKVNNKALMLSDIDVKEQDRFDYLFNNIKDKKVALDTTIKGSQYKEPKFCFSGACSGCGETPYLKLLTQLFGDNMIIANATGCSSIYGASAPSTPYNVPWASSLFEDNAEYGYGMLIGINTLRNRISKIMTDNMDNKNHELFKKWIDNYDSYEITKEVYDKIDYDNVPKELLDLKEYIKSKVVWTVGGDGWAYDIGYGGIDHVLSTNDDVNILVLDTEVYSNTGGQSSKSSHIGSIAGFTSSGKVNSKKDLARLAMSYPNAYVAQTSLGANMMQTIKCLKEAANHKGPSIVICYSPCISHGIKGGMTNSINSSKEAVLSGYFPTFRYNPKDKQFTLDSKNVDFDKYEDFLNSQNRYSRLKDVNDNYEQLIAKNKEAAIQRYEYYKKKEEKND